MKQRYLISKTDTEMVIQEKAELDQGVYSLLCECRVSLEELAAAVEKGQAAVISLFRSNDIFPSQFYSMQIADSMVGLLRGEATEEPVELNFSDMDYLHKDLVIDMSKEYDDEDSDDLDDILDDSLDDDDDYIDDDLKNLDGGTDPTSLKVADDDIGDMDIDS